MKSKISDLAFQIIISLGFTLFCLLCFYPFYYVLIYSLSDPLAAQKIGVTFWPVSLTFSNYLNLSKLNNLGNSAFISAARAITGTAITLFFSSMFGFVFTRREMFYRKFFYRLTATALYISAGLIPYYMTMRLYGLKDSFWLYILPAAIAPFYVILLKTYFEQIPEEIIESSLIDGANFFKIFVKMVLPLSLPVLAAVGVFSLVGQWNSWFDNFLLVSNPRLQTLQYVLLKYLKEASSISNSMNIDLNLAKTIRLTATSVRMTVTMIAIFPIACVYPLLQKYFIKGIMMGAVKG